MTGTLATRQGSPYARLYSVASYTPSRVVDNAEMCTYIESTDEWIQQRTGIAQRRWIGEGETLESISLAAGAEAIKRAGIAPDQIDAVILATISYLEQTPALSAILAAKLGAHRAAAYDISAACAGFSYAVAQADALVRSGAATYVLIIGSETLSEITDVHDRSTAFLFADGAGAAVIGPSDVPAISPVVWGSDGDQASVIVMSHRWPESVKLGEPSQLVMDGQAVFRWATTFIADVAKRVLAESGITPDQLDAFIPHQANNRITDAMLRHLKLPEHVVVARTIKHLGNNSAASIPMAMDALLTSGEVKSGQTALIIGFGAGLAYAGQVVTLP